MVRDHSDREREETHCHNYMGYSFQLAARALLYAPSHRQDSTYRDLCCTRALAETRINWRESTMKDRSDDPLHHELAFYHGPTSHSIFSLCYFLLVRTI